MHVTGEPDLSAQVETNALRQRQRLASPEHRARMRRLRRLDEALSRLLSVGSVVVNLLAVPLLFALDAAQFAWMYLGVGALCGGIIGAYLLGGLRRHRHGHTLFQLASALSMPAAGALPMIVLVSFMFSFW